MFVNSYFIVLVRSIGRVSVEERARIQRRSEDIAAGGRDFPKKIFSKTEEESIAVQYASRRLFISDYFLLFAKKFRFFGVGRVGCGHPLSRRK